MGQQQQPLQQHPLTSSKYSPVHSPRHSLTVPPIFPALPELEAQPCSADSSPKTSPPTIPLTLSASNLECYVKESKRLSSTSSEQSIRRSSTTDSNLINRGAPEIGDVSCQLKDAERGHRNGPEPGHRQGPEPGPRRDSDWRHRRVSQLDLANYGHLFPLVTTEDVYQLQGKDAEALLHANQRANRRQS